MISPISSFFGETSEAPATLGSFDNCPVGTSPDPICSRTAEAKRYVGWGFVGAFAGALVGHFVFPQHAILSSVAGLAGGVAIAAKSSIDKCTLSDGCTKA